MASFSQIPTRFIPALALTLPVIDGRTNVSPASILKFGLVPAFKVWTATKIASMSSVTSKASAIAARFLPTASGFVLSFAGF